MIKRDCPYCGWRMEIDSYTCPECGKYSQPGAFTYIFAYIFWVAGFLAMAAIIGVVYLVFIGKKPILEVTGLGKAISKINEVAKPGY